MHRHSERCGRPLTALETAVERTTSIRVGRVECELGIKHSSSVPCSLFPIRCLVLPHTLLIRSNQLLLCNIRRPHIPILPGSTMTATHSRSLNLHVLRRLRLLKRKSSSSSIPSFGGRLGRRVGRIKASSVRISYISLLRLRCLQMG